MKREDFKTYLKFWFDTNTVDDVLFRTDYYIEQRLNASETEDVEGDFIFENDSFVVGKYYHSIELTADISKSGKIETLYFLIIGVGYKDELGDLITYDGVDYNLI